MGRAYTWAVAMTMLVPTGMAAQAATDPSSSELLWAAPGSSQPTPSKSPSSASAVGMSAPTEVMTALKAPRLLGQGRLRFLGMKVYDARLWVEPGFDASRHEERPLALELAYERQLVGRMIAERSLKEMQAQADIPPATASQWLAQMTQLFPDVKAGDRITGVYQPGRAARFFLNGRLRGEVNDPLFAKRFFDIWLSPKTSEPKLRLKLLGESPP